ncbi:hypothetical protein E4U13_005741 [Claviceps humidiphila]|uniref:Uncharacterized protein n=1 Tax=Claviceps humidiphila TaxID=1294629 RepID=A0A9P7PXH9_9HYPO|nr:hypothetical protein E4U13_005741 [Claviceps humidiphila]
MATMQAASHVGGRGVDCRSSQFPPDDAGPQDEYQITSANVSGYSSGSTDMLFEFPKSTELGMSKAGMVNSQ